MMRGAGVVRVRILMNPLHFGGTGWLEGIVSKDRRDGSRRIGRRRSTGPALPLKVVFMSLELASVRGAWAK